jgi:hypothetical protein
VKRATLRLASALYVPGRQPERCSLHSLTADFAWQGFRQKKMCQKKWLIFCTFVKKISNLVPG